MFAFGSWCTITHFLAFQVKKKCGRPWRFLYFFSLKSFPKRNAISTNTWKKGEPRFSNIFPKPHRGVLIQRGDRRSVTKTPPPCSPPPGRWEGRWRYTRVFSSAAWLISRLGARSKKSWFLSFFLSFYVLYQCYIFTAHLLFSANSSFLWHNEEFN